MRRLVAVPLLLMLPACASTHVRPSGREAAPCIQQVARHVPAAKLERATGPDKAFRWRRLAWLGEDGVIPPDALQRALAEREQNIARSLRGC